LLKVRPILGRLQGRRLDPLNTLPDALAGYCAAGCGSRGLVGGSTRTVMEKRRLGIMHAGRLLAQPGSWVALTSVCPAELAENTPVALPVAGSAPVLIGAKTLGSPLAGAVQA
jgi:hypothetical protein